MVKWLAVRWKAVVAAAGAISTWGTVALADGQVTQQEWIGLAIAVIGVIGVHQVKNQSSPPSS